jgi:orotidine-5'-phosphate decarboxylase
MADSNASKVEGGPRHFADRLTAAVRGRGNPVTVGLDPRYEQLPEGLRTAAAGDYAAQAAACLAFCTGVIDVVAPLVPALKPQAAFYERLGPQGMLVLAEVIRYARDKGLLVILDGKRNDIGPTAAAYAQAYLGAPPSSPWGADAMTVNPYLGDDSLTPFVEHAVNHGAGVFVLVKTSNPGGGLFQDVTAEGRAMYRRVGQHVEKLARETVGACGYGAVGAVVGATYARQTVELRAEMPHTWFLLPGYGSQGAKAADVAGAFDAQGLGATVNNARGIIFAYARPEYAGRFGVARWQEAVEAATRQMIDELATETTAGKLAASSSS